jgi:hypothetical protein
MDLRIHGARSAMDLDQVNLGAHPVSSGQKGDRSCELALGGAHLPVRRQLEGEVAMDEACATLVAMELGEPDPVLQGCLAATGVAELELRPAEDVASCDACLGILFRRGCSQRALGERECFARASLDEVVSLSRPLQG